MNTRSKPSHTDSKRSSLTLSHLRQTQLNAVRTRSNENIFASLRATQIISSKPVLPAELLATILDYLPVPDLVQCARVSRRLQEMVYDDTRWIAKLKAMGVWDEGEARQRTEEALRRKAEAQRAREAEDVRRTGSGAVNGSVGPGPGGGRRHAGSVTLFDAGLEEDRHRRSLERPGSAKKGRALADGFDDLTISGPSSNTGGPWDPSLAVSVLGRVRSIRGHARQEFGKVYRALGPLYKDLDRSSDNTNAMVFTTYQDPEQRAQVLAALGRFASCDNALGCPQRREQLDGMIEDFESAMLQQFEEGHAAGDRDGRMRRCAHVLVALNGGNAAIESYISNHPLMTRTLRLGNAYNCLEGVAYGHVDLNPSQIFFEKLTNVMVEQSDTLDLLFPRSVDVLTPFMERAINGVVAGYLTTLFDEAHHKSNETYVKAVSGTFKQSTRFVASLKPSAASPPDLTERVKKMMFQIYEQYAESYTKEELSVFKVKSEATVYHWEKELSEQEASTESFFMSNINRQAAKRDFLSSFRKVVMMPVNAIPTFGTTKAAPAKAAAVTDSNQPPDSPSLNGATSPMRSTTPLPEAPTTELAAKAAIMNSRLEGIKSLFSIEVALNLTHFAKSSIERLALLVQLGGTSGETARVQCGTIFTTLLNILGYRHVQGGFDKAVGHLGQYNPRQVHTVRAEASGSPNPDEDSTTSGVEPLVTFLELVNVGDLIQQMIEVFYSQELIATDLTDRDDFLDPAVKEKKRFEQMIDSRVAAGLNKGIDVLIDEVDYILATSQEPTDFNPPATTLPETGPTSTAVRVVATLRHHTSLLIGTSDKSTLDVFVTEVGLRLFTVLAKHFKRQRISVDGAIRFIADINCYSDFITSLRQRPLLPYFSALREMAQLYLVHIDPPSAYFASAPSSRPGTPSSAGGPSTPVDPTAKKKSKNRASMFGGGSSSSASTQQAKELAAIVADTQRYRGVFSSEEVCEFAQRRADWYLVRGDVERAMYGVGCIVM